MSAATSPLPVYPPPRNRTAVDLAVLDLFTSDDLAKRLDAWRHLVRICHRGKAHLFLRERGFSNFEAMDYFLRCWLDDKLAPYFHASAAELEAAVDRGEFQYLARQAKYAVIDELRRCGRAHEPLVGSNAVSLSKPIGEEENGDELTREDVIGLPADAGYLCPLGTWPPVEPDELQAVLANDELKQRLGDRHYNDLVTLCSGFDAWKAKGDPSRAIASTNGVSIQAALWRLRQLRSRIKELFSTEAVQTLHDLLARRSRPVLVT